MNLDPHPRPHPGPVRPPRRLAPLAALALLAAVSGPARASTPAELGAGYAAQAGVPPSPARGEAFFTSLHGREWRCATCHGTDPRQAGRHAATGQAIRPFAPAAEPARFTDPAKVEKWFRRNCRDVVGRECTPGEKADVIAWLLGVKS
jgi:hypothetical protein